MYTTMSTCGICKETPDTPVALPCGHLFCEECLLRAVDAVIPFTTLHNCLLCHSPYNVANLDPSTVPVQIRSHILPSIRRIHLDSAQDKPEGPRTVSSMDEIALENRRLHAENEALKNTCAMWRRRAELHGAATLGLLGFSRTTRDIALRMRFERDEVYKHYNRLRGMLPKNDVSQHPPPPPPSTGPELPPLPSVPHFIEVKIPGASSRHPQLRSTPTETEPTRPTKRARSPDASG